jgi:hypothetical protein
MPPIVVPTYTKSTLPAAGTTGSLAAVTDTVRGLWMDTGSQWVSRFGEIVNVKDFGAKGDNSVNDRQAVLDAIAACPEYATGFFPAGQYRIDSTLTIEKQDVAVYGASVGDAGSIAPPSGLDNDLIWCAYVRAADTVEIRLYNTRAGSSATVGTGTWKAIVSKV